MFPWQGAEALTHRVHEPGHRWQTVGDDWITGLDGTRVLQPRATWRAGPNDDGAASRAMHTVGQSVDQQDRTSVSFCQTLQAGGIAG